MNYIDPKLKRKIQAATDKGDYESARELLGQIPNEQIVDSLIDAANRSLCFVGTNQEVSRSKLVDFDYSKLNSDCIYYISGADGAIEVANSEDVKTRVNEIARKDPPGLIVIMEGKK